MLFGLLIALAQEPHRPLSIEEMAAASPFSGVAVVERIDVRHDPSTGAAYTDARLRIRETWGAPFPPEVVLTQVGGTLDGRRSAAVGWNYTLSPGAVIAIFCKHWKGPYFSATGMRQGVLHVEQERAIRDMDRSPDGGPRPSLPLAELRARVGRTLGRELLPAAPTRRAEAPSAEEAGEAPPPPPAPRSPARESASRLFWALAAALILAALLLRKKLFKAVLLVAAVGALAPGGRAEAYLPWTTDDTVGGPRVQWRAGSPSPPWDDATKTLTYRLNTLNFPAGNLPSIDQAGAALHNSFQSIEDIPGASIRFRRGTNVASSPLQGDGQVHVYFHTSSGLDPFGSDISGIFAITYPQFNGATGTIGDMDIFFNALASVFTWSTRAPSPPPGSNDIEVTLIHEALHAIGLLHPVYFYAAVWPVGRTPELVMIDRCYAPDDKAGVRLLYPEAPLLGRITGTVRIGATNVDRAIVVATDADGVPQATIHAEGGAFDLSVPPGTYSVTAHHRRNSTYTGGDIPFLGGATGFFSASVVTGVVVNAGATTSGVAVTATPGTPTMTLAQVGTPGNLASQIQVLPRGSSGTLRLAVRSTPDATFTAADVASVDLGPGITATLGPVAALNVNTTRVDLDYAVAAGAAPGVRNLRLTRTNGERLFLPAYHEVAGVGGLAIAVGPANPASAPVSAGAIDQPVLQLRLAATAVEDLRVRRLAFTLAGSAPPPLDVKLWRDANADGQVDAGDERILTSAAFALAIPSSQTLTTPLFEDIGIPLLAGTSTDLLLTFDLPAAGSGDYQVSLAAADVETHGMVYGDVVAPGGSAAGGVLTLGTLIAGGLGQFDGGVAIPPGGSTAQTSVTFRATVNATQGMVGFDLELTTAGAGFTGMPTHSTATTFTSGTQISLPAGGLSSGTAYQWRIRPVSTLLGTGAWVPGSTFSVDQSVSTLGVPREQLDFNFIPMAAGGRTRSTAYLQAPVLNSSGFPVALQVEVVPAGQAFTNTATLTTAFGTSGALARAAFSGSGPYRWQARAVSAFGAASAWTDFGANGTAADFLVNAETIEADAGCVASASSTVPWLGVLLLVPLLGRRKGAAALVFLLASTPAWAQEVGVSAGALVMDSEFETIGSDLTARELDGLGLGAVDVEVLLDVGADWRVGLAGEAAFGGDLRAFGAGPLVAWRIGEGHWLRAGALFTRLEVRESGFGDFEAAVVPRAGYEYRFSLGSGFSARIGAEARWSRFEYEEDVVAGDDTLGGAAVLLYVGLGLSP